MSFVFIHGDTICIVDARKIALDVGRAVHGGGVYHAD